LLLVGLLAGERVVEMNLKPERIFLLLKRSKAALWWLVLSLVFLFQLYAFTRAFRTGKALTAISIPADSNAVSPSTVSNTFLDTLPNSATPPAAAPTGMLWIPGGEFSMGANDPPDMDEVGMKATEDARPIHRVYVDGFFMDTTDVTNAQFAEFVKATGYI